MWIRVFEPEGTLEILWSHSSILSAEKLKLRMVKQLSQCQKVQFSSVHTLKRDIKKQPQFSSVQSLSRVRLFATPWTAAGQASLPNTNSWSLLKLMSIESGIPSNHLILCHPLLPPSIFPSIRSFQMSQFFPSGGQSIEVSASTSVLPMNTQDWSPLEWTG